MFSPYMYCIIGIIIYMYIYIYIYSSAHCKDPVPRDAGIGWLMKGAPP